jgi:hypothetical protein
VKRIVAVSIYLLSAVYILNAQEKASPNTNIAAQLKAFLVEKPAIERVVFSVRDFFDLDAEIAEMKKLNPGGQVNLTNYHHYFGAWQTGDYFIRNIQDIADADCMLRSNDDRFMGRSGRVFWSAYNNGAIKHEVRETVILESIFSAHIKEIKEISVASIALLGCQFKSWVLDLSLTCPNTNSIYFDNNHFSTYLFYGPSDIRAVNGEVIEDDGKVSAIRYEETNASTFTEIKLEYSQSPKLPPFFPSRLTRIEHDKNTRSVRTNYVVEYSELILAKKMLSSEFFLPDRFYNNSSVGVSMDLKGRRPTAEIYMSNGIVTQKRIGTNIIALSQNRSESINKPRVIFVAILMLSTLIPILLAIRKKQLTTNRKNENT